MTTKDFDKLGDECFNHLKALNPKGGMKTFIRIAVEFGYQRAVKNLTIPRVTNWRFWNDNRNNRIVGFIVGLIAGIVIYTCL